MSATQPPVATVFEMLQGLWASHIVSAITKLDIPDRLHPDARTAGELAEATGTDRGCLQRVLRTAAAMGVLREDNDGRFHLTALSEPLRAGASPSMKAIATFFSDEWHVRAWERLPETVRTGRPALDLAYGISFFEYLAKNPAPAATFFEGMTNFSSIEGPAVVAAYDFTQFGRLCDVGGGLGLLLALVLGRHARVTGVLLDQPQVVSEAKERGPLVEFGERVTFVPGDMFASVPPGVDAYLLKRIVHDWSDSDCVRILRNCRSGINRGGKLLIVEQVIMKGEASLTAKLMDLEMMVLLGGKERDEDDFRGLLADSGWRLNRIVPTESAMFILECEPD